MASLDWLAVAPTDKLRDILQAHLEDPSIEVTQPDSSSTFARAIIEAWVIKDWKACEQFAWDCAMPDSVRRNLLVETFKLAASRYPDEVYDRLEKLKNKGRFLSKSLLRDGTDVQCGGDCYMGYVPQYVGKAWIKRDGAKAVERFKTLNDEWKPGVVMGAVENFSSASAGIALLDWMNEMDSAEPQRKAEERSWQPHHREIKVTLGRLTDIDPGSATRWIEAKPERYAKSDDTFDNFHVIYAAMSKRDPLAAAAWGQKLRPDDDTTWELIHTLLNKDEKLAVDWMNTHSDDPHIESAYAAMADYWQTNAPGEAAKMVAKMNKGELRAMRAALLYESWSRLDEKAAMNFLDGVFGIGSEERRNIDKEIERLEQYAFDRRK